MTIARLKRFSRGTFCTFSKYWTNYPSKRKSAGIGLFCEIFPLEGLIPEEQCMNVSTALVEQNRNQPYIRESKAAV